MSRTCRRAAPGRGDGEPSLVIVGCEILVDDDVADLGAEGGRHACAAVPAASRSSGPLSRTERLGRSSLLWFVLRSAEKARMSS